VLGAFVFMPLLLVSASFVMAWLTLWNRSFWPAVFMHGAINSVYDGMTTKVTLTPESPYTMKLIELGVFAAFAAVAFHLARPMARRIVDSA
jgi:membrane protease YdiL (CAAX protease family)